MKTVAIIRDRGQLTIPDSVRKEISWVLPFSAVSIVIVSPEEIRIRPHRQALNWNDIWNKIRVSRKIRARSHIDTSMFLAKDRRSH